MVSGRVFRSCLLAVAAGAILLGFACPAPAAEPTTEELAQAAGKKHELLTSRVGRITRDIESGRLQGKDLAEAYRFRGITYSQLNDDERAVRDFTSAIELEQVTTQYYEDRAIGYLRLREFAKANTDLDMALGLDTKYPAAHREKGRLAAYQGEYAQAARSFALAMENDHGMGAVYGAIWLHVAATRAGLEGSSPLPQIAAALPPTHWPAPVIQMLLGASAPEEAIAAADNPDPDTYLEQKCEAYFYAGQYYLTQHDTERARAAFDAAVATGVAEFLEYDWARRELELMKAGKK